MTVLGQVTYPVNGTTDPRYATFALTNAKIFVDYKTVLDSATLLIKDGLITEAGKNVTIPKDAVTYDLAGRTIYPSLIDPFSEYGVPKTAKRESGDGKPQFLSNTKGAYGWNQAVKAENDAYKYFSSDEKEANELRKLGFGIMSCVQRDGIARGSSVLVLLGDGKENDLIIRDRSAAHFSFDKGSSTQDYPSSLMGSIALLRQSFYDASWYVAGGYKQEYNITLEALGKLQALPQIFDAGDKLNVLRAAAIGKEFSKKFIVKTNGTDYQQLQEIKEAGNSLIVPLQFPEAYDLTDPQEALNISYAQMKSWEYAPANAAYLSHEKIPFAFTLTDLKNKQDFWKNLRKAIQYGLSEEEALKALTYTPASLLGVEKTAGSLMKGMLANFIITSQNIFNKDNVILENWVKGKRFVFKEFIKPDIRGTYSLNIAGESLLQIDVSGNLVTPDIVILEDTTKIKVSYVRQASKINLFFELKKTKTAFSLIGEITDALTWEGTVLKPEAELNQPSKTWIAKLTKAFITEIKLDTAKKDTVVLGKIFYPFNAYSWTEKPVSRKVLFKNATVWTNESQGILQNTDVLISNGKIQQVGKNISSQDADVVDATGKYLTSGIIDEHSHIAVSGSVNEGTQSSSAEVRIGDVIDCDDIDIYRQLSGGVTTSHILHGSANAIGGQTQLVKLRWGSSPEKMKFEGWPGYIKFALGENVKQSNWGDLQVSRFPQTRMGVEQVYVDYFTRAKDYDGKWKKYSLSKEKTSTPRRDLELDALAEILNSKRFITCHSYVQSEINMLMHVADSFGFKVNTFTHILEGYKVADKMKKHGAGASSFSDWWAYKMEVMEAIPYNGAIMHDVGLTVAYNSDDAEMARRLNQEAAKAVKYGGVSEAEAWKFVTLNPAKLLRIDNRTGSIAVGKDADVVLWNDNPLSIYAKALQTYVDGIKYYDAETDKKMRETIRTEKIRLAQKMTEAKKKGEATQPSVVKLSAKKHCMEEEYYFLHTVNHE